MGQFTRAIRSLQKQHAALTSGSTVEDKKGRTRVKPHAAVVKGSCPKCKKTHTVNDHRFHGVNSHLRTHGKG